MPTKSLVPHKCPIVKLTTACRLQPFYNDTRGLYSCLQLPLRFDLNCSSACHIFFIHTRPNLGARPMQKDASGEPGTEDGKAWGEAKPALQSVAPGPSSQDATNLGRNFPAFARPSRTEVRCSGLQLVYMVITICRTIERRRTICKS